MPTARVYLIVLLGQAIFAATPLFLKIALQDFDPLTLGFWRFLISALLLNLLLLARGNKLTAYGKNLLPIILLGVLAIPLNQVVLFYGLRLTTPGHSTLMFALTPMFVYLLAIVILHEQISLRKFAGIIVALIGVAIVLADQHIKYEPRFAAGDAIILLSVLAWAAYTAFGKKVVAQVGSLETTAYTLTFAALAFLPIGAYPAAAFDYRAVHPMAWTGLLYAAVLASVIAYPIWYWALKYFEASRRSAFIYVQPLIATTLSFFFLQEELTTNFLLGGAIIIGGVIITERA